MIPASVALYRRDALFGRPSNWGSPVDELSLNAVLNQLPMAAVIVRAPRLVVQANTAALELFGQAMVGADFVQTVRHPAGLKAIDTVLGAGGEQEIELPLQKPIRAIYRMRASRAENTGAEPRAIVSFLDITDKRAAEAMRSEFVANVSHELRSPLTAMSGFIETLKNGAGEDPQTRARFLGIMESEANRMNRLIGDLLSLSRVEEGERLRPDQSVDVGAIVRRVIAILEPQAQAAGIPLRIAGADDIASGVLGDQDQLAQVFMNLIENAIKYGASPAGVDVTFETTARLAGVEGAALIVAVRDHGEGIPREHLGRLTERFYRIDDSRSRALGGTGLGLAIVKHILSRHRGRLQIESRPGKGSTFRVCLPLLDTPD